ncbi:competence protein ComEC [Chryseobacterium sp. H1D6B]|uniref:ComEC/Rec2 family competence protein n=1 Tax=Chryseobacterium sp. H1D6B TaxID=2940588 RepID=UPI0015C9F3BD|nr:ComEC/Rec2 family competence protein [Chryseobacterium sp. H1D6B]MDH6251145.1 competence protein ComEC [Chryseobacterium sp. H1D6B]
MNKQPFLILVICFIFGIFFQDQFGLNRNVIYAVSVSCLLIFSCTLSKSYFVYKSRSILLGLMFFGIGTALHYFNMPSSEKIEVSDNETVIFKISKKLNSNEKYKKYEAFVQVGKNEFNAVIHLPKREKELDFTHYYKGEAYIVQPESPQYDFQFDYAEYLKRKNIFYQCYLSNGVTQAVRNDLGLNENILQKRLDVLKSIDKTDMSPQSREFLKGIILADRTEMDAETVQDFSRSGLVHFLAISGTHIIVIFGLFYLLFKRMLSLKFRKYAVVSSLMFIWLFAGFIGFGNSVLRSCIMLTVYFIYVLLQRKPDLLHSLALSAFVILISDTQQIFDVGFQMSFLAVFGIYWLNEPILKHFPKQTNRFKKIVFNTVSISLSAQLATLPLVLYYFHQFSFISILANFIIVPFSELIIIFSFLITILFAFKIDFSLITSIYDSVIQVLLRSIHWFAGFDSLFYENISMNLMEMVFLFAIIYLLRFAVLKCNFKNAAKLGMSVLLFLIIRVSSDVFENQKEEVLTHHYKKGKIFSIKVNKNACFWIENTSDKDKVMRYIITPYKSSRRLEKVVIKTLPALTDRAVYNRKIYNLN